MNILLSNSTDIFAGGEDYVLILARYLTQRGHAVFVSARPGHLLLQKCTDAGIPVVPVDYTGMGRLFAVGRELRRELRARRIALVHSNANYDRTAAALAAAVLPVSHIAGVHSAHSIQHNITHWMRNRWGIDHYIADAEQVKDVLVREDGIPASRITVIPIGVENDSEGFRAEARTRTRSALGIDGRTLVVGNVARLVPFKGHHVLLGAAARVLRERDDVLFVIAGDGELMDELTARADTLGIADRVRFLGFRDDLDRLYPAFDVYCHSSRELAAEAFPLAILRALAAGLPVVCTKVGGIAMMVEEGVTGHLTPPDDPERLSLGLLDVLARPERRTAMGQASFTLFTRRFHASAMAERVEALYTMVVERRRRRSTQDT